MVTGKPQESSGCDAESARGPVRRGFYRQWQQVTDHASRLVQLIPFVIDLGEIPGRQNRSGGIFTRARLGKHQGVAENSFRIEQLTLEQKASPNMHCR